MKLKFSILLALAALLAVSCGEKEPEQSSAPFEAETTEIAVPAEGCKEAVYEFSTTLSWSARSLKDVSQWFTFSPERGSAGKASIKYSATKNESGISRSATVTVIVGTASKDIVFTQEAWSSSEPEPDPEPETELYDDVPTGFTDEPQSSEADPKGTADLSVFADMGHPRLLMNRADFADLKRKVTTESAANATLAKLHNLMMELADESAKATSSIKYYTTNTNRNQDQAKLAMKRISSCAYAYRMTGKQKYLTRAVEDLGTVVDFPDWNASIKFLTTAQMAAAVAIGYDWLYYSLDYDLRVKIRERLLNYAIIPAHSASSFIREATNWNQVCYGGTLLGAIAIYGKEKTESGALINECIANNGEMIRAIYEPEGVYPEGYSYWGFGSGFQAYIFAALEKVFGTLYGMDGFDALSKTANWLLMSSGVGGRTYCFGDSTGSYDQPKMGMWWFAMHYNNPSLLRNELRLLRNESGTETNPYSTSMSEVRMLSVAIACALRTEGLDSVTESSGDKPTIYSATKGEVPLALFRTVWDSSYSDRYLGFKGGKAGHTHGHMDAGAFVYDALGLRWSQELNRPDYTTIENALNEAGGSYWNLGQDSYRWKVWVLNNRGHSTLTINGADHRVDGAASLVETWDTPQRRGGKLDLSPVFSGEAASVYRSFEIKDGTDLYITDEITALPGKDAGIQWRMVTSASVKEDSDMETLTQDGKTLYLKVKSSAAPTFTTWPAQGTNSWDTANAGKTVAGYTATVPAGQTVTFVTILTTDKSL